MKKQAWIIALLLLITVFLLPVQAEAAVVSSGKCGDNLTWTLDDAGKLTISGTGAMYDHPNESNPYWGSAVKTVTVGKGVTTIGIFAFYGCDNMESISIPDSVTRIGDCAFLNCQSLKSISIPSSVTIIGLHAFDYCQSLTSLTIPGNVKTIDAGAFYECSGLETVTILKGVESIGDAAFKKCTSLENIVIPDSVTTIGEEAFLDCTNLKTVSISDSVTTIGENAFWRCPSLTGITVDPNNPSYSNDAYGVLFNKDKTDLIRYPTARSGAYTIPNSVTSIHPFSFYYSSGLTAVTIPGSVTQIGEWAFCLCDGLTSLTISNGVAILGENAFSACYKLNSVTIPGSVTHVGDSAFAGCAELKEIRFMGNAPKIYRNAFKDATASAYYPSGNTTWTLDVMQNYGGTLTWNGMAVNLSNVTITKVIPHTTGNILYWDAVAGGDIYQIYRLNGSSWELLKNTRSLGYKDETALPGVKHYYKIVARNGDSKSDIKTTASVGVIRPAAALANVTITEALGHSSGNILRWNAVENAKLYQVYRLDSGKWTLLKNTGSLGYKDETAPAGVKRYYKIVARNGDLKSNISTTASVGVTRPAAAAKLDNVTITKAIAHSTGNILYWDAVDNAQLYQVYRLKDGAWTLLKNTGSLAYKDETAPYGVKCYYKIIARNGNIKSDIATTASYGVTRPIPADGMPITLKVWGCEEDLAHEGSWLYGQMAAFEKAHPEYQITWELQVCAPGDAGNLVSADPEAAADVYMYDYYVLSQLVEAGALTRLSGEYLTRVQNDNDEIMVDSVTYTDGGVYGFPFASNTWFMYYDKSVFSEADIKSLDTMLQKGRVAFPMTTGWYLGSFYAANGATFFGAKGNDSSAGIRLGDGGTDVTKYLVQLVQNPNFFNDWGGDGIQGLEDGTVSAMFSGTWDAQNVRTILGDNMGVAPLPCITINGQQKQMKPFASASVAMGVNPHSDYPEAAMQFAAFLSTAEAQKARYLEMGPYQVPTSLSLLSDPVIQADPVAMAQILTIRDAAIFQPAVPEMAYYWQPAADMGQWIINGHVTADNAAEVTKWFENAINGGY